MAEVYEWSCKCGKVIKSLDQRQQDNNVYIHKLNCEEWAHLLTDDDSSEAFEGTSSDANETSQ